MIRLELPSPLRRLANVGCEVRFELTAPVTQGGLVDALEQRYPMLRGTVRDSATGERRSYLRFFAGGEDISQEGMGARLPVAVESGREPLLIVGAVAGG